MYKVLYGIGTETLYFRGVILKYPPCPPWGWLAFGVGKAGTSKASRILQATGIFATSRKKSVVLAVLGVAVVARLARSLSLPTAVVLAVSGDGGG